MGHFIISLPDGKLGDVRYGTVRKKSSIFSLFSKNKNEAKTGYVVRFSDNMSTQHEYRLFKSMEGRWSIDEEGQMELDSKLYLSIKNAISEKESNGQ